MIEDNDCVIASEDLGEGIKIGDGGTVVFDPGYKESTPLNERFCEVDFDSFGDKKTATITVSHDKLILTHKWNGVRSVPVWVPEAYQKYLEQDPDAE